MEWTTLSQGQTRRLHRGIEWDIRTEEIDNLSDEAKNFGRNISRKIYKSRKAKATSNSIENGGWFICWLLNGNNKKEGECWRETREKESENKSIKRWSWIYRSSERECIRMHPESEWSRKRWPTGICVEWMCVCVCMTWTREERGGWCVTISRGEKMEKGEKKGDWNGIDWEGGRERDEEDKQQCESDKTEAKKSLKGKVDCLTAWMGKGGRKTKRQWNREIAAKAEQFKMNREIAKSCECRSREVNRSDEIYQIHPKAQIRRHCNMRLMSKIQYRVQKNEE